MKFTTYKYTDISTGEIVEPGTAQAVENEQLGLLDSGPYTFASYDDGCFMYVPTSTPAEEVAKALLDHGFMQRMVDIFVEAKKQGIPYLRFDANGEEIKHDVEPSGLLVWVVSFTHKHGISTYVFESEEAAEQAPADWAMAWWDQHIDDPVPASLSGLDSPDVLRYFEETEEYYVITPSEVNRSVEVATSA